MRRILLAEDDENIATIVSMCLEDEGYEVIQRADGIEALKAIYDLKPLIVLLDLLLPRMSGYLILRALRENPATAELPVMVMSAKSQKEDIQEAYDQGADDYLVKPFTPSELIEHVSRLIDRGR